jgi:hypothetical protein
MGTFNIMKASGRCPRCNAEIEFQLDMHFGFTSMMQDLKIGDKYPWLDNGRPEGGNVDGEGYMSCPRCCKDSFWRVIVRNDVIVKIEPDVTKKGYMPD